jgi:hypothetical protein
VIPNIHPLPAGIIRRLRQLQHLLRVGEPSKWNNFNAEVHASLLGRDKDKKLGILSDRIILINLNREQVISLPAIETLPDASILHERYGQFERKISGKLRVS